MSGEIAAVALGSNLRSNLRPELDSPRAILDSAVRALARIERTRLVAVSAWHETEPVGGPPGQGKYLNGAAVLQTELAPRELHAELLRIEREHGRVRRERDGPRTLDLDLVSYGTRVLDEPDLVLPHPRAHLRRFVLEPLCEIAPALPLARHGPDVRAALLRLEALPKVEAERA